MRNVLLTFSLLLFAGMSFGQIKVITNGYVGVAGISSPVEQLHVGGDIVLEELNNSNTGDARNISISGLDDSRRMQVSTSPSTLSSNAYFQMFGNETCPGCAAARTGEFALAGAYIQMRTGNTSSSFGNIQWELDGAGNVTNFGGSTSTSFRIIADADKLAKSSNFKYGLTEVLQMEPKKFTSTLAKSNTAESIGVLADDIAKIVPELVTTVEYNDYDNEVHASYDAVDMTAITFMLVNSIKEQQELIEAQNERIAEMEATIMNLGNGSTQAVEIRDSRLGQNAPNPFSQATVINYTVPTKANTAVMQIFDLNGQVLKTVNVANGNGQLTINAGELAAGTYSYNLVVNGVIVDTKKMVLTK